LEELRVVEDDTSSDGGGSWFHATVELDKLTMMDGGVGCTRNKGLTFTRSDLLDDVGWSSIEVFIET
jgi:hypothetical protein